MPKQKENIQHGAPMTKRQRARWEQERTKQRNITRAVAAVLVLVVLIIAIGILFDKVLVPNKTVAQVANQEISNSKYQVYRQISQAQRAYSTNAQAEQFSQFQSGGGEQFATQIQADITALRDKNAPIDYAIMDQLIDNQIIIDNTAAEGITVSDDEVQQSLVKKFTPANQSSQPVAPISPTGTLTGTTALTSTTAVSPTATPTLSAPEAQSQLDVAIQTYYDTLKVFIEQNSPYGTAILSFTGAQFKNFVLEQERIDLLREKLGKKLVDESAASKAVYADADQIFISVSVPPTETLEISATLWNAGKAKIDAIAKELASGKDFASVQAAKSEYKEDPSRPQGLRPLTEYAQLGITEPISTQPVGVIGDPYRSEQGWHIVRVKQRELRPDQNDLDQKRGEAILKWVEAKRAAAIVKRFPEPTATALPPTLEPAVAPPADGVPTAEPALNQPTPTP